MKGQCQFKNTLQVCQGDGVPAYHVTIFYRNATMDEFDLCTDCMLFIKSDARTKGCGWEVRKL